MRRITSRKEATAFSLQELSKAVNDKMFWRFLNRVAVSGLMTQKVGRSKDSSIYVVHIQLLKSIHLGYLKGYLYFLIVVQKPW